MTETPPPATLFAASRLPPTLSVPLTSFRPHNGSPAPHVVEADDDGEIKCICLYTHDDGNTVCCDGCGRWQHIVCYYPNEHELPDATQQHYCVECFPQQHVNLGQAAERQRLFLEQKALEQRSVLNGFRKNAKSHKKKPKEPGIVTAQLNGFNERQNLTHASERKSVSPRDLQPPAKRPKTTHRPSQSVGSNLHAVPHTNGVRKRNGSNMHHRHSPAKSLDDAPPYTPIDLYSKEFVKAVHPQSSYREIQANLYEGIGVTNLLSEWLNFPDALIKVTNGRESGEVFQRWDSRIEDIPGQPLIEIMPRQDDRVTFDGVHPTWRSLTVQHDVAYGTFIGELMGRVGLRQHYMEEPLNRWSTLRHPEPHVFFHPDLPIYIDAREQGTHLRYVQRSCSPNTRIGTIITEGSEFHFCLMATRDLQAGEEVTVSWDFSNGMADHLSTRMINGGQLDISDSEFVCTWASTVLANCGPCACAGLYRPCAMASFDRRWQPPDTSLSSSKGVKPKKRKAGYQVSPLNTGLATNSRASSEARRGDFDEENTDSRSVSGSLRAGSNSRDITPNTHYSAALSNVVPELSERERKKIEREERIFAQQEQQQRKKRNSGGSNLNTPTATASRQLGHPSNAPSPTDGPSATHSRHADAGSAKAESVNGTAGKRAGKATGKAPRKPAVARVPAMSPSTTNASTQTQSVRDPDPSASATSPRQPSRFISVTQRLLHQAAANRIKRKRITGNTVLVARPKQDSSAAEPSNPQPPSHGTGAGSVAVAELRTDSPACSESLSASADVGMKDADDVDHDDEGDAPKAVARSSLPAGKPDAPHVGTDTLSATEQPLISSHPPMDPPPPPWPPVSSPSPPASMSHRLHKFHMTMPPPPAHLFSQTSSTSAGTPGSLGGAFAQSPLSLSGQPPIFSPTVTATVAPSPARKKLSLSEYTRRKANDAETSHAQDGSPAAAVPTLVPSTSDLVNGMLPPGSAVEPTSEDSPDTVS
ncbi:SET domain-containing protein 3 [Elasticomyces elasticus]|nr:SET domain-containing protein 3 [Elasticomyces elasticus]